MRSTHTYAKMAVSHAVYVEISNKLIAAGYDHALHDNGERGYLLDMHGIALEQMEASCQQGAPCGDPANCPDPEGCGHVNIREWQPIDTLPDHVPEDDDQILAATDDGRRMIWRIALLKGQLERLSQGRQPEHLSFPATR